MLTTQSRKVPSSYIQTPLPLTRHKCFNPKHSHQHLHLHYLCLSLHKLSTWSNWSNPAPPLCVTFPHPLSVLGPALYLLLLLSLCFPSLIVWIHVIVPRNPLDKTIVVWPLELQPTWYEQYIPTSVGKQTHKSLSVWEFKCQFGW